MSPRIRSIHRGGLAVALLAALASGHWGCAATLRDPAEVDPETTIEVRNQNTLAMNVYVAREGGPWERLGTAESLRTTWFTVPRPLVFGITSLRFRADPIGSPRATVSQEIPVAPGDTVVVQIPPR